LVEEELDLVEVVVMLRTAVIDAGRDVEEVLVADALVRERLCVLLVDRLEVLVRVDLEDEGVEGVLKAEEVVLGVRVVLVEAVVVEAAVVLRDVAVLRSEVSELELREVEVDDPVIPADVVDEVPRVVVDGDEVIGLLDEEAEMESTAFSQMTSRIASALSPACSKASGRKPVHRRRASVVSGRS
jgi:hypothetical protein